MVHGRTSDSRWERHTLPPDEDRRKTVVVVGGSGVFGRRLSALLIRDGHDVRIAGRSLGKTQDAAAALGALPLRIDLNGDLDPLFEDRPDIVIDASGPFRIDVGDPFRLPRACIERGVNYLDLSDDTSFTAGIVTLDAQAKAAGCLVLSGVSTTPALSAAVVEALSEGMDEISLIDTALLPGNRAPRGRAVIESILGNAGAPLQVWRGGRWIAATGWSDPRSYELSADLVRRGYLIEVPDLALFPQRFGARSVLFRAGQELRLMNIGVRIWSLMKLRPFPWLVRIIHWLADRLEPFGTDRGGMQVTVIGLMNGELRRRRWTLLAASGDGPYIPGVVARALLCNPDGIVPGARPDLGETPLGAVEAAFQDLDVASHVSDDIFRPLFQTVLGKAWDTLPAEVQALHTVVDREVFSGDATVEGGTSVVARIVSALFNFPSDRHAVPVTVTMTRTDQGETWVRDFGGKVFRSHLSTTGRTGRINERFGLFRFELEVPVVPGEGLRLPVCGGRFLGLPLPRFLLPISDAREYVEDGWFRFDVDIRAPLGLGRIARYRGRLVRREG